MESRGECEGAKSPSPPAGRLQLLPATVASSRTFEVLLTIVSFCFHFPPKYKEVKHFREVIFFIRPHCERHKSSALCPPTVA